MVQSAPKTHIVVIPKGTPVPFGTALIHEDGPYFSLQAAAPMDIEIYNAIVSAFLSKMEILTRDEWLSKYPLGTQIVVW
jgi:hypothetical protein